MDMAVTSEAFQENVTPSAKASSPAQDASTEGWFYLLQGQHLGPFTIPQLTDYHATGYVGPSTMVWRSGRTEWQPLKDVPELEDVLKQGGELYAKAISTAAASSIEATARDAGNAVDTSADVGADFATQSNADSHSKRDPAAPIVAAKPQSADPMATFLGEISAIEADNAAADQPPGSPDEKLFVDDDGTAYQWDPVARRFVEAGGATASTAAAQAAAADASFDQADQTFSFEAEVIPAMPDIEPASDDEAAEGTGKHKADKRKLEDAIERELAKKAKAKGDADTKAQWFQLQQNSSVYVTGLPADATDAELVAVFTKCGVIKLDDERRPRIKVYKSEDGSGKGDGLVTYLKKPSVDLAIQILDGTPLRDGDSLKMKITQASFEQKGKFVPKKGGGSKQRKKRVLEKQEQSELGWGGFDDVAPPTKTTVVLRHAFHPDEFAADPLLREQLEDDMRDEASKQGVVENVKVYQTNPKGVVTIKFRMEDAAQKCIALMHGRFFGGRKLEAALWDGIERFYVKPVVVKESEEDQARRLEQYAAELEQGEDLKP